ncbi:MAG: hypothetical protein IT280_03330 [Ignavibacteria bacterium]|nr:hypothetical protein [Ignavibacteria bacterium]
MPKRKVSSKTSVKNYSVLIPENKYAEFALLFIFLVLVFLASSYKITGDDDLFWHLATGRYIVNSGSVPDKDVFGHITSGQEWIPFEWGWDVLTFGLYNLGGYNAILIFRSLSFCFIFFVLYFLMKKLKVPPLLSIFLLFVLLISIMDRLSPRPHILTYIYFALLLYLLLNFKYVNRELFKKRLYFIPLIFLFWANSHMGVLAGGLILFVFTITETIIYFKPVSFSNEIKPLNNSEIKILWIISVISALMLLVNPHFINTYLYAYNHTKMKLLESVNEWQNPFGSKIDLGFTLKLYKVLLFSGVFVLYYAFKKKDLYFALTFIAFAVYSVRAVRFTVDYNIIMIVFIAVSIAYILSRIKNINIKKIYSGVASKAVLGLFILYIISQIPSGKIYEQLQYYRPFGWGIDRSFFPMDLIEFMKQNNIKGIPFNHFGTGGLLVWNFPGEKNFIDSRNLNDEIFNEYNSILTMKRGFENKLLERNIDYILYLDPDLIRRPNDLKGVIVSYLSSNPDWKLVYWDDRSFLFLKNIPKFSEIISKYEYKYFNPYTAIFNKSLFETNVLKNKQDAEKEIKRKQDTEPGGYLFQFMNQSASKIINDQ